MSRATNNPASRRRRKKVLKQAKGFEGSRGVLYRTASNAVMKKLTYQYRDRKVRKREMRGLWIIRINAACRINDISYSKFINGLKKSSIEIDRKILADLAVKNEVVFGKLVEEVKASAA
ncbi:MAG: 50S ribosomal protein L20 [Candidatus Ancaeobacter aquaticus]|nr:50S ribosomal protein L20 [Candidatus Ancaeobacter aquaticus]